LINLITSAVFLEALGFALAVGVVCGYLMYRLYRSQTLGQAQSEAEEILQGAKDRAEIHDLEEKEFTQELEAKLWTQEEPGMLKTEENIEELTEDVEAKKQKADNHYSQVRQKTVEIENRLKDEELRVLELEKKMTSLRDGLGKLQSEYTDALCQKSAHKKSDIVAEISQTLTQAASDRSVKFIEQKIIDFKEQSEDMGRQILDTVYARFARAYCGERGISGVYFETPEQRKVLIDTEGKNIALVSELTGCDIYVEDESGLIGVAGFDPVRREMTRRLLERLLKEKNPVTQKFIRDKFEHIRKELVSLIKKDGDNLSKELGLNNLHPEIRQMMGTLRYRYSFTQNQYFHCAEVGWLCGLLAEEIDAVDVRKARRAGMLHDLGKSMDHQLDGGHAMIGANFIEKRGEAADIVHAVRSHHFDEQPSTNLAFLVIAADAISGARPGARRSTMETYTQKVTELDAIARSFDGVSDCYVLNGGRELRVVVNSKKVDDIKAMKLGSEIAHRVEEECNYPGQIKVMVVRETTATEMTR
jgi:ribonuclease Y